MEDEQRRRRRLYEKFLSKSTSGNLPVGTFDEDDLLDIYDFASDIADDYAQLLILMTAQSQCPGSEDFMERRAYYFDEVLGMSSSIKECVRLHAGESLLWDLLLLRINAPEPDKAKKELFRIVSAYDEYDDEAIIRIVEVSRQLGIFQWLNDNVDLVRRCAIYEDTLLHEMARECSDAGMYPDAIKYLDELTGIDPFNKSYWHLLAEQYLSIDDHTNALTAIDFGLAVDNKDYNLRLLKAQALYDVDEGARRAEALELAESIFKKNPHDPKAVSTFVIMLALSDRGDEAAKIIEKYVRNHPDDREVITRALLIGKISVCVDLLLLWLKLNDSVTETEIRTMVDKELADDRFIGATSIMMAWVVHSGSITMMEELFRHLYIVTDYEDIVRIFDGVAERNSDEWLQDALVPALIAAFSRIRCGDADAATSVRRLHEAAGSDSARTKYPVESFAVRAKCEEILRLLADNDADPRTGIDGLDIFAQK